MDKYDISNYNPDDPYIQDMDEHICRHPDGDHRDPEEQGAKE